MNLEPVLHFVREREAIRHKRLAGEAAPWTDDPILQRYRFCNVRREHDRVSQWLIRNVLVPPIPPETQWRSLDRFLLLATLCRWVNWPPTIELLLEHFMTINPPDFEVIGHKIDARTASGEKAWTGAYMVRAKPGYGRGKGHFIAVDVIKNCLMPALPSIREALQTGSRQATWAAFTQVSNFGSFTSGQIVADLGYTALLRDAPDTFTWAPQGPGSVRGLNRVLGRPLKSRFKDEEFCIYLQEIRSAIISELGPAYDSLTLHDVQNVMCEYSKYAKALLGEGRPRATYKPETVF